jgi:hypothetical protein
MSSKHNDTDVRGAMLKNEFTRQRWDLFHRAIAHAKQTNDEALEDADMASSQAKPSGPILTIVR